MSITHSLSMNYGAHAWTTCGLIHSLERPLVFDAAPTCLWCVAGRKSEPLTGARATFFEPSSVFAPADRSSK